MAQREGLHVLAILPAAAAPVFQGRLPSLAPREAASALAALGAGLVRTAEGGDPAQRVSMLVMVIHKVSMLVYTAQLLQRHELARSGADVRACVAAACLCVSALFDLATAEDAEYVTRKVESAGLLPALAAQMSALAALPAAQIARLPDAGCALLEAWVKLAVLWQQHAHPQPLADAAFAATCLPAARLASAELRGAAATSGRGSGGGGGRGSSSSSHTAGQASWPSWSQLDVVQRALAAGQLLCELTTTTVHAPPVVAFSTAAAHELRQLAAAWVAVNLEQCSAGASSAGASSAGASSAGASSAGASSAGASSAGASSAGGTRPRSASAAQLLTALGMPCLRGWLPPEGWRPPSKVAPRVLVTLANTVDAGGITTNMTQALAPALLELLVALPHVDVLMPGLLALHLLAPACLEGLIEASRARAADFMTAFISQLGPAVVAATKCQLTDDDVALQWARPAQAGGAPASAAAAGSSCSTAAAGTAEAAPATAAAAVAEPAPIEPEPDSEPRELQLHVLALYGQLQALLLAFAPTGPAPRGSEYSAVSELVEAALAGNQPCQVAAALSSGLRSFAAAALNGGCSAPGMQLPPLLPFALGNSEGQEIGHYGRLELAVLLALRCVDGLRRHTRQQQQQQQAALAGGRGGRAQPLPQTAQLELAVTCIKAALACGPTISERMVGTAARVFDSAAFVGLEQAEAGLLAAGLLAAPVTAAGSAAAAASPAETAPAGAPPPWRSAAGAVPPAVWLGLTGRALWALASLLRERQQQPAAQFGQHMQLLVRLVNYCDKKRSLALLDVCKQLLALPHAPGGGELPPGALPRVAGDLLPAAQAAIDALSGPAATALDKVLDPDGATPLRAPGLVARMIVLPLLNNALDAWLPALEAAGGALCCAAVTPLCCGAPSCTCLDQLSERALVSKRGCAAACGGACTCGARYHSRACQRGSWALHKAAHNAELRERRGAAA